jgi:hypothetical protein
MDCLFNEIINSEYELQLFYLIKAKRIYINVIIWLEEYDEYNRGIKIKLNCIIKFYGMSR